MPLYGWILLAAVLFIGIYLALGWWVRFWPFKIVSWGPGQRPDPYGDERR